MRWTWAGSFLICLAFAELSKGADQHLLATDDAGRSLSVVQSDKPIVVFQQQVDLAITGGFFRRPQAWADQQNLRITSLNGQAFVFLGNERAATIDLAQAKPDDMLLRFTEKGFTLQIKALGQPTVPPSDANQPAGVRLDIQITRP